MDGGLWTSDRLPFFTMANWTHFANLGFIFCHGAIWVGSHGLKLYHSLHASWWMVFDYWYPLNVHHSHLTSIYNRRFCQAPGAANIFIDALLVIDSFIVWGLFFCCHILRSLLQVAVECPSLVVYLDNGLWTSDCLLPFHCGKCEICTETQTYRTVIAKCELITSHIEFVNCTDTTCNFKNCNFKNWQFYK